jgi:hypothetical protein
MLGALRDRPLLWAIPLTVVVALGGTADMIFREEVRRLYETNADIAEILRYAESATPADIPRWWAGTWIEISSPYYRPLASTLFFVEAKLFHGAWRPLCLVSWFLHAGVCVLILLLLRRLATGTPAVRVLPGVLATALFSLPCETTVDGPHWGNRGIARGLMPYWPAQTDLGCLLLSLLSLILVDRWLETQRRRTLIGAVLCFFAALLFKEQAVVAPLLAAVLAFHRRASWKLIGSVGGVGLAGSALFLVLRKVLVPQAWGPQFKGVGYLATKLVVYLCEPALDAVANHQGWIIVSAALVTACVALALFRPRFLVYAFLGLLVAVLLPPQLMTGNMALATVMPQGWWLLRVTWFLVLLLLVWEARNRAPTLPLLAALVIVHLPILHVIGPHYYYWPVAWWSMLVAVVLLSLPGTLRAAAARSAGAASPAAVE